MPRYKRRRRFNETPEDALARAKASTSVANFPAIIEGFKALGIAEADITPRENVFTYQAWKAKGRQVMKGQHGVRIPTVIEVPKPKSGDPTPEPAPEDPTKVRKRKWATVFHVSQTKPIGEPDPPGTPNPGPTPQRNPEPPRSPEGPQGNPDTLRDKADAMQKAIDDKLDPAIGRQNPTRRRQSIAASMRQEAYAMQDTQKGLRAIASAIEAGTLPRCLWHVRHKSQVDEIRSGWNVPDEQHQALKDLIGGRDPMQQRREAILEAERQLLGAKIDGFFPTPRELCERVVMKLDPQPDHEVLEPSAGKGDLAEAIRDQCPECELICIERHHQLCDLLELKELQHACGDFLEAHGEVDRVAMNPPFENGQDAQHVQHAYSLLRPGGRLVAIMSIGPFHRQDSKAKAFREWLENIQYAGAEVEVEELGRPFEQLGTFRRTGVVCRLLTIDKP